ncbi:hypothetical protein M758_3G060300 [Ceratodon purpureus]|nr:hypothetical protein M758_3G060300 [Ceratodon purpureus]
MGGFLRGRSLHSYGRGGSFAKPWCQLEQTRGRRRNQLCALSCQREYSQKHRRSQNPRSPNLQHSSHNNQPLQKRSPPTANAHTLSPPHPRYSSQHAPNS